MTTLEERVQKLEDEAAIRDLAARFADAATRGDYETVRSLFKRDAIFIVGEPASVTLKGVNEIDAHIRKLRDGKDFFVQFVHSGPIRLDGNTASARWLMQEVGLGPAKSGPGKSCYNDFGLFIDEFEKVDGRWLSKYETTHTSIWTQIRLPGKAWP